MGVGVLQNWAEQCETFATTLKQRQQTEHFEVNKLLVKIFCISTPNFQLSTLISKQPVIPQYPPCNNSPSITHVLYGNAAGLLDGWLTFWLRNPECEVLMCWTVLYRYFVFRLAAIWTRGYIFPVPVVVVVVVLFDINAFLKALNVSCCRYYCRVGSCPVFLPSTKEWIG